MWQPPQSCFEVKPLDQSWATPLPDPEKKQQFAHELAKGLKPFEAATAVFPDNMGLALWVSQNWVNDLEVVQIKQTQLDETEIKLLDKEHLAVKVLKFSEEKDPSGKFYLAEDKTRLAALKLYAEICGYVGKVDIDASTKHFNTTNEMKIVLVSPPKKEEPKIIEHPPIEHSANVVPLKVKLV